jgi:hypothetical protein
MRQRIRYCYRALALRGGSETRVLSRNQNDLGKKFTNIRDSIAGLDVQDAIIDGEIVALMASTPSAARGSTSVSISHTRSKSVSHGSGPADRRIQVLNSFQLGMDFALGELQGYNRLAPYPLLPHP